MVFEKEIKNIYSHFKILILKKKSSILNQNKNKIGKTISPS
jgi:hypothetical protein